MILSNAHDFKYYRFNSGFSQSSLAACLGVSRETVWRIENGKYNAALSLPLALKIKKLIKCPLSILLTQEQLEFISH